MIGTEPGESLAEKGTVCLIRPPSTEMVRFTTGSIVPPLGLAYVAASLEQAGWRTPVIDAVGEGPTLRTKYYSGFCVGLRLDEIVARIPAEANAIGITIMFTHDWPLVVKLVELIRARFPETPIILGGEHVTAMPEFSLLTSAADYLVLGEGEETAVDLLTALSEGGDLADVEGIAYRRGDELRVNRRRVRCREVDEIPEPAWHHFDLRTYHAHRFVGGTYSPDMTIPILATRGCPYQCTFCASANMWTTRWIPRKPEKVVDEIERYMREYGARNFPFHDLTAITKKTWIVAFCKEILRRGLDISWQLPTGTRSEVIDAEVAGLLRASGMRSVSYAPESGSATTRRIIKKRVDGEKLLRSVAASSQAGLSVSIFMILGFPHEREEHLAENLPFIDELLRNGADDMSISYFVALPGTELFDSLYEAGKIRFDRDYFRHILAQLSMIPSTNHCEHVDKKTLIKWKTRMFLRFYAGLGRGGVGAKALAWIPNVISGLRRSSEHESKLQTAVRNGLSRGAEMVKCNLSKRWIPMEEELRLFAGWDETLKSIRARKRAAGQLTHAPADTSKLHERNVNTVLPGEHKAAFSLPTV